MSDFLTDKQEAVLRFIEDYQMSFGKSPTIKEMREHFQVSSDNSIIKHLKALEEKGFIKKDDTPRGIQLLESVKEKLHNVVDSFKLPLLGSIPAGGPVIAEENIDRWVNVGDDITAKKDGMFLLEVTGESMIDAGIFEGDLVVVDSEKKAKSGDVVVALIDGANTLKRFIKEANNTYLKAENKKYNDIYPVSELLVQGVVTALIRKF